MGCSITIASAHPTKNFGATPFACTNIHIFRSPDFKPVIVERQKVGSIGSGSEVSTYVDALKRIQADKSLLQLGVNSPKMLAHTISHKIMRTVENFPTAGISKYLQFGIMKREEAIVTNLEFILHNKPLFPFHTYSERHGSVIEVKLPHLVKGEKDFLDYCRGRNNIASKAMC